MKTSKHYLLTSLLVLGGIPLEGIAETYPVEPSPDTRPDNAANTLKTVTVEATAEEADGPVEGYHAKRSATGTKTDTPLLETPVSVQVITRDLMDEQQALTLADAVKNVSGVYTRQGPDGNTADSFNIRGFQLASYGSSYMDGVKDYSRAPKETAGLERVEVLKGPAAIMYGRIEPGGMINRVAKKPQAEAFTTLQQQAGSHNYFRTTLDSNGALSGDQSWLYRVNLAVEDANGFKDDTHNKRLYIAPQIEWLAGEHTSIRTGLEYQENERSWALTYGTIGDSNGPINVPLSTNLHDKDDHYEDDSLSWFLTWDHAINENWEFKQRITYVERDSVAQGTWINDVDDNGNYSREYWGWDDEDSQIISTNLDLTGKVETGGIKHTLLAGLDYFDEDYDSGGWAGGGTVLTTNIYNPNHNDAPYDLDYTSSEYWYSNENAGFYLQDQMAMLDDNLHLMLGLRYDQADYLNVFGTNQRASADQHTTWRGGLLYKLTPRASVYTSYVEGFGSPNATTPEQEDFDPQTAHQYEVGTKVELTPQLGVTLAVFRLIKDNLTMANPLNKDQTILAGEATSDGVELDITGQLTEHWDIIASYAYTDVRYTNSDRYQGQRLHSVPRHGASLWNSYRFANTGWQIGGGAEYRSERLGMQRPLGTTTSLYPYTMDAYTLLNLMVGYDFEIANLPVKAQLNVSNATDEVYFPSTYGSRSRIAQGTPRNVMGSIQVSF